MDGGGRRKRKLSAHKGEDESGRESKSITLQQRRSCALRYILIM